VSTILFAQKKDNEQFTVDVTKITFIEPGVGHEFALGRTTSFYARVGITATVAPYNSYSEKSYGFLTRGFFSGTGRVYYNAPKRADMGRNIEHNSANYFAWLFLIATQPINKWSSYSQNLNNPMINTGLVWGMQRNYPFGFSLDFNIGLGYVKVGYESGIAPISELNIGWWFGKKHS
jgi:hypothetical protein